MLQQIKSFISHSFFLFLSFFPQSSMRATLLIREPFPVFRNFDAGNVRLRENLTNPSRDVDLA